MYDDPIYSASFLVCLLIRVFPWRRNAVKLAMVCFNVSIVS